MRLGFFNMITSLVWRWFRCTSGRGKAVWTHFCPAFSAYRGPLGYGIGCQSEQCVLNFGCLQELLSNRVDRGIGSGAGLFSALQWVRLRVSYLGLSRDPHSFNRRVWKGVQHGRRRFLKSYWNVKAGEICLQFSPENISFQLRNRTGVSALIAYATVRTSICNVCVSKPFCVVGWYLCFQLSCIGVVVRNVEETYSICHSPDTGSLLIKPICWTFWPSLSFVPSVNFRIQGQFCFDGLADLSICISYMLVDFLKSE